ncbi:MAG: hypothetical protein OEU98_08510, partial [Actinomycetota bacterium]|nr:hypothetical protein [Actinomycetota bacterium]
MVRSAIARDFGWVVGRRVPTSDNRTVAGRFAAAGRFPWAGGWPDSVRVFGGTLSMRLPTSVI